MNILQSLSRPRPTDATATLHSLRPADATPAAIAEALDRARTAESEAAAAVTAALERRDDLLLDGTPEQLRAAETAVREARESAERLGAMVAQLASRHRTMKRAAIEAKVEQDCNDTEATALAVEAWWQRQLPTLRAMEAEGRKLLEAHETARTAWFLSMPPSFQFERPVGYGTPTPQPVKIDSAGYFVRRAREWLKTDDDNKAALAGRTAQ